MKGLKFEDNFSTGMHLVRVKKDFLYVSLEFKGRYSSKKFFPVNYKRLCDKIVALQSGVRY